MSSSCPVAVVAGLNCLRPRLLQSRAPVGSDLACNSKIRCSPRFHWHYRSIVGFALYEGKLRRCPISEPAKYLATRREIHTNKRLAKPPANQRKGESRLPMLSELDFHRGHRPGSYKARDLWPLLRCLRSLRSRHSIHKKQRRTNPQNHRQMKHWVGDPEFSGRSSGY